MKKKILNLCKDNMRAPLILSIFSLVVLSSNYLFFNLSKAGIKKNERKHQELLLDTITSTLSPDNNVIDSITNINKSITNDIFYIDNYNVCRDSKKILEIAYIRTKLGYNGDIFIFISKDKNGFIDKVITTIHKETPGLGDQIEYKKSNWSKQFYGLNDNINLKRYGGTIDSISGATISSNAVTKAVSAYAKIPFVENNTNCK